MRTITDETFQQLIERALGELPQEHIDNLDNVAITFAENPTSRQLQHQGVRRGALLLGLYEGIPLTKRLSSSYSGVLPDRITLFKQPILTVSTTDEELFEQIKRTLWHEIAHHYGLSHDDIDKLENKTPKKEEK